MDHVIWSRRFHELPDAVLQADMDESYGHFVRNFGRPDGFTSPGFYSDARVMRMIGRMGFTYDGDAIGGEPRRATADGDTLRHWTIPVTLCGPGTVPFLEYHGARQTPERQMLEELDRHLEGRIWWCCTVTPATRACASRCCARCSRASWSTVSTS